MNIYDQIINKIESLDKELIRYVQKLISYPSVSGREMEAQLYVKEVLEEDLNFIEVDFWEPDIEQMRGHEAFIAYSGRIRPLIPVTPSH